ncbi:MAG: hypothetical protein M5U15_13755 [Kiritimatiellae bacterium]|nr:hypothetical protein [Kiritimatiellia bacterium]
MSLPTNYSEDWWLIKDSPKSLIEEVRSGESGAVMGYRERRMFTVAIARRSFKVTTFVSEQGSTKSSFTLKTGPNTSVGVAYTGKKVLLRGTHARFSERRNRRI